MDIGYAHSHKCNLHLTQHRWVSIRTLLSVNHSISPKIILQYINIRTRRYLAGRTVQHGPTTREKIYPFLSRSDLTSSMISAFDKLIFFLSDRNPCGCGTFQRIMGDNVSLLSHNTTTTIH